MPQIQWNSITNLESRRFICANCGQPLASEKGWIGHSPSNTTVKSYIYICHQCSAPTFFTHSGKQIPGVVFGNPVQDITDQSVSNLYDEARNATGSSCYTAAVLACRKLLMHIAVSKGAPQGETFVKYVEYLLNNHYIPPDAKDWVDHIRKIGNEANHEINIMTQDQAHELLSFIEMLLKVIYEFPSAIKKKYAKTP